MTDTLPPLTSVPLGQAPPDERPSWQRLGRRKPGRKAGPAAQRRERAPARPREATGAPAGRTGSLRVRIGGALAMLNMIALVIPATSRDALSPVEVDALAKGVDAQCQASPRFRRYVETALAASGASGLVGVIAMIAARRVARHGIVPEFIDGAIGAMMGDTDTPVAVAAPVAAPGPAANVGDALAPDENLPPVGAPGLPTNEGNGIGVFDYEAGGFVPVTG